MEQTKGFRDLNNEIRKQHNSCPQIKQCNEHLFWFENLNGKNYFFKVIAENNQKYRSFIIEEMAKMVSIPVTHTELAYFNDDEGELIEDYRRDDHWYVAGERILNEYFQTMKNSNYIESILPQYLLKDRLSKEEKIELIKRLNNLEVIWNSLIWYLKDFTQKEPWVYQIMRNLANRFAFDFLTMQRDRHASNWELEVNETSASLTPLFDSNRSFYHPSFNLELRVNDLYYLSYLYEELDYYLTYSEASFCTFFYHLYQFFFSRKIGKYPRASRT